MNYKRRLDAVGTTILVMITVIALFIASMVIADFINEANRIDEGTIVDKHYQPAYTHYSSDKNGGYLHSYPDTYTFTIEGTNGSKTVRYTFEVTAEEYRSYNIGDYYKR